ncbi:MAG: hypothetical protein HY791_17010 [Deltaproteobacteria bacterium]|nr:hypothetical protein [Deltaproteobacteria bacterium]
MTTVGVVCEAEDDFATAKTLIGRVLFEEANWIDGDTYQHVCVFAGLEPGRQFTTWTGLPRIRQSWPRRQAHGKFSGEPGAPMATAARTALLHFFAADPRPDAVLLMKDGDHEAPERLRGLEQARDRRSPMPVVLAVPVPEREAWCLSGFVAETEGEQESLQTVRRRIGFDPTASSHRLSSKNPTDKRDCKRALDELTASVRERAEKCIAEMQLEALRRRAQRTLEFSRRGASSPRTPSHRPRSFPAGRTVSTCLSGGLSRKSESEV